MKRDFMNDMQNAYNVYNINDDASLPNRILEYLKSRIEENRNEIEKIISIFEAKITVNEIIDIIEDEKNKKPKSMGKTIVDKNGFMFAQVLEPVGIIALRAYDPLEVIKYWVRAIKTKNAIAVVSKFYSEHSLESLILLITKEALKKFNINENLVEYLPEDKIEYELFDKVIYTCDKDGNIFEKPESQDIFKLSGNAKKKFVYIEDEIFRAEAEKNEDAEFITGDIEEVIANVKNANSVVIYTKDSNKAYKFINLANAGNVFVNTNLQNAFETLSNDDELYRYKNVIIPVPKELLEKAENINNVKDNKTENAADTKPVSDNNQSIKANMMVEYKENLWTKIKRILKDLFKF